DAQREGSQKGYGETVEYGGRRIVVGSPDHWALMKRACLAKFEQHQQSRDALLSTGDRPLTHKTRHDSRAIPGVIMAEIWMQVRARMRSAQQKPVANETGP